MMIIINMESFYLLVLIDKKTPLIANNNKHKLKRDTVTIKDGVSEQSLNFK